MGGVSSLASLGLNLALSQQAASKQKKELQKDRDEKIADLQAKTSAASAKAQDKLRRQLADQRARAGANGIASTGGSIDAVLRGLEQQTARDITERERQAATQVDQIRSSFSSKQQRNLLDFSSRWLGSSGKSSVSSLLR